MYRRKSRKGWTISPSYGMIPAMSEKAVEGNFFQTRRGAIVAALRRHHRVAAADLAEMFGLSVNAIRRHLLSLEQDGLVVASAIRRGRTKPTTLYALTAAGEQLFPQRYDRMLNAVLRGMRERLGSDAVESVFDALADEAIERYGERLRQGDSEERIVNLAEVLRHHGVRAEVETLSPERIVLYEHNCPYVRSVAEHPEVCRVVHRLLDVASPDGYRQTASLAQGDAACRFEIATHLVQRESL